jgi:hypothetical protein
MISKGVLKRFSLDRFPEESKNEFLDRTDDVMQKTIADFVKNNPEHKDVDYDYSFIWSERRDIMECRVVEILEIPMCVGLADNGRCYSQGELLIFHDRVEHTEYSGYTADIDPEEAMVLLKNSLDKIENAILKVRNIIDAKDN